MNRQLYEMNVLNRLVVQQSSSSRILRRPNVKTPQIGQGDSHFDRQKAKSSSCKVFLYAYTSVGPPACVHACVCVCVCVCVPALWLPNRLTVHPSVCLPALTSPFLPLAGMVWPGLPPTYVRLCLFFETCVVGALDIRLIETAVLSILNYCLGVEFKIQIPISLLRHVLSVLKRTISSRWLFWIPATFA